MQAQIFLLLGSNEGDRAENLKKAISAIEGNLGVIRQRSSVYCTAPWGNTKQQDFYNQVVEVASSLDPQALLRAIETIEGMLGRKRTEKWGPRTIDIDILFYDNVIVQSESLTVPHPGIPARKFTLVPLSEVAADFIHPQLNLSVRELLQQCHDDLAVEQVAI